MKYNCISMTVSCLIEGNYRGNQLLKGIFLNGQLALVFFQGSYSYSSHHHFYHQIHLFREHRDIGLVST